MIGASLRYQCLYSVSLQRESNADYNSVTNKNSEFDPDITELLLNGRRVNETKFIAP